MLDPHHLPALRALDAALSDILTRAESIITKAPEPTWRKIHRIVTEAEPRIQRTFLTAVSHVQDGTQIAAVRTAYEAGNLDAAMDIIPWEKLGRPYIKTQLVKEIRDVYDKAGAVSVAQLPEPQQFEVVSDRALNWMRAYAGDVPDRGIAQISAQTLDGIRASLSSMLEQGLSANQAALLIRPQIGLTEAMSGSVNRLAARMAEDGASQAAILEETTTYSAKLIRQRALNIARTESHFAAIAGQREGWDQAAGTMFDPAIAQRRWVANPGACEECQGYDGITVAYSDEFPQGDPPAHPSCSCGVDIIFGEED